MGAPTAHSAAGDLPAAFAARIEKARGLIAHGEVSAALEILDTVLRSFPDTVQGLRLRAGLLTGRGETDAALRDHDRLVDLAPNQADIHYDRALTHLFANHPHRSLADLDRCLILDPEFAPAHATRAGIHVRTGNYLAALSAVNEALRIRPGNLGDLHNRAVVETALGRYETAVADYRTVIAADPHSAGSCNNLAWVLATAKDPAVRDGEQAVRYAREAVKMGDNAPWLDTLAAAYAECGDYPRAVATAEEAYRRSQPPNENFRARAGIYRSGRTLAQWREKKARNDERRAS